MTLTKGKVIPKFLSPYLDSIENIFFLGNLKTFWSRLIAHCEIQPGEKIIDIGCGSGNLTLMMAKEVEKVALVVGLDASKDLIMSNKKYNTYKQVTFIEGIMENISFPENSFDLVVSSFAIHHVPKTAKQKAFAEFKRILKPGGRLLIMDHGKPYLWPLLIFLFPLRWNIFEFQAENFRGEIPAMIKQVFGNVVEKDRFFGWIRIWKAHK